MHYPSWELRDRLFLTRLLPEPDQVNLRATATTSQRLAEGARRSAEAQATATPLPTYVMEFRSVFAKEDFDMLPVKGAKGNLAVTSKYKRGR